MRGKNKKDKMHHLEHKRKQIKGGAFYANLVKWKEKRLSVGGGTHNW